MDNNTEIIDNTEVTLSESEVSEESVSAEAQSTSEDSDVLDAVPEKTEIVGIRFKKEGKTYYFAPNGFTLKSNERVIVDTARGLEYGYTAVPNTEVKTSELVMPLREVIRVATEEDTRIHSENMKREIEAYNTCIALIDEHNPKMKLIDVECAFDRSKLLFYFSAEERVDFREIVKALASTFHTRIEMRQIGIRDEAKMLGGLGVCGRPFCCSAFLNDFVQVSVKMAKEQNISLNAAKISGACGKLMCCLRYEYETYVAEKALTPKVGSRVVTPDGPGEVTDSSPLQGIVKVRLDGKGEDSEQVAYVREDVVKEEEYNGEQLTKTEIPKRGKQKEEEDVFASFASVVSGTSGVPEAKEKKDSGNSHSDTQVKNNEKTQSGRQVKNNVAEKPTAEVNEAVDKSEAPDEKVSGNVKNEGGQNGNRRRKKHKGHNRGGQNGQSGQGSDEKRDVQEGKAPQENGATTESRDGQGQNGGHDRGAQSGGHGQNGGRHFHNRQNGHNKNGGQGGQQNHSSQNPQNAQQSHSSRNPQNGQPAHNGQSSKGGQGKKKPFKPYHKRFGSGENKGNGGGGQSGGEK